jgi:inosine-uridine nucleoside N-ribohydrolase
MSKTNPLFRRDFLRSLSLASAAAVPLLSGLFSAKQAQAQTSSTSSKNATGRAPIPVIFDTDIGTDVDDTWALAQLLRCPELDTKFILAASGDMTFRSTITARFLQEVGRTDIPIGKGINKTMRDAMRNQEPWIKGYDVSKYKGEIVEDGIGRMIRIIEESPVPVTVIAVAPSMNIAAALARAPHIAARCRFVGMYGSFDVGYNGRAPGVAETNVRVDPVAFRAVMAAPWKDILLTPLDTCNFAVLDGANYQRLWRATNDPMMRAVIENYCVFAPRVDWMNVNYFTQRTTVLFDCVAVYLAYAEDWTEVETIRFNITDKGITVRDAEGPYTARVAIRWKNLPAFKNDLTERLLTGVKPS